MNLRRLVALGAVLAVLAAVASAGWAWTNHARFYAVDSGSMSPTIATGSLVVDLPTTPATVFHVGDVVTFHPTPAYTITHRIAAIGPDGIVTKGDANPSRDVGYLQPDMIVGRVAFFIPFAGYVAVFFQHPMGVIALLLLLLALAVVWELTGSSAAPRAVEPTMGHDVG